MSRALARPTAGNADLDTRVGHQIFDSLDTLFAATKIVIEETRPLTNLGASYESATPNDGLKGRGVLVVQATLGIAGLSMRRPH